MKATARQGETVDALCWRVLGRTAGVTEQVLELNPGTADAGATYAGGESVVLPDAPAPGTVRRATINLWDD